MTTLGSAGGRCGGGGEGKRRPRRQEDRRARQRDHRKRYESGPRPSSTSDGVDARRRSRNRTRRRSCHRPRRRCQCRQSHHRRTQATAPCHVCHRGFRYYVVASLRMYGTLVVTSPRERYGGKECWLHQDEMLYPTQRRTPPGGQGAGNRRHHRFGDVCQEASSGDTSVM